MTLKMKLLPALVAAMAAMAAGCGGGGSGAGTEPSGKTLLTPVALLSATSLCVDQNSNWQCDDGDRNGASTVATAQGLSNAGMPHVSGSAYTLLEQRDAVNLRTQLWVSEAGSSTVTALSTLRSRLATQGKSLAQINAMAATLSAAYGTGLEALLGTGFKAALPMRATAIDALDAYSLAVFNALSANAVLPAYTPTMGSATTDATWDSDTVDQRRQLSAQSSVVLNNSDGNRLYLFDAAQPSVSSRELDLIPPALPVMAGYPSLLRQSVAWLGKAVSVLVDTASAATALVGAPTPGSPVVLPPGKGIAGIQLVDGGNTAYVLMNMLSGVYTQSGCLGTTDGNEGLFKVSLTDAASTRFLSQSPACIHSGFSLMAADAKGLALAAWDATGQRLWLINGNTMVRKGSIDLKFDPNKPPQAMAMTPGGHYLAVAGDGRITLIDVDNARIVTQQSGDWSDVAQIAFANGGRSLLIASGSQVHTLSLDDSLLPIARSVQTVAGSGETLRGLAVVAGGDGYVATSDTQAYWHGFGKNTALARRALPAGLRVQQAALAGKRLVLLAYSSVSQQFNLVRLPIDVAL